MNSDSHVVAHQRNHELSSQEVNRGACIFQVKQYLRNKAMLGMIGRYLVSMEDTCWWHILSSQDINIKVPLELY